MIHHTIKAQTALFIAEKVSILAKYLDYINIFLKTLAKVFLKQTGINKYIIKLQNGKQLSYKLIYSLSLVQLKILKTHIEKNLANNFVWPLKSLISLFLFFVKKLKNIICLCINY